MVTPYDSALKKPTVYETKKIELTSSLVHIGSAVSRLNPFEYVQTDKKVYFPDSEALAKALLQQGRGFLEDYIKTIEDSRDRQDIRPLLEQAFKSEWWTKTDAAGNPIFPEHAISRKWTEAKITDLRPLRPMIRNGMGQLFIPGSSIKGAIRTAIAYHLLKHAERYQVPAKNRVSEIEKTLINKLGASNKFQHKFFDDQLFMKSLFSDFSLTYQGRTAQLRNSGDTSSNTDFLRVLKVSDTQPLLEDKALQKGKPIPVNVPIVSEVIVSSRFPDYKAKYKASIYAEMVRNVKTEFTLTLDVEMLKWFEHQQGMKLPFKNLEELLQICQEFTQEQWDDEHDYWSEIEDNPRAAGENLNFSRIREFYKPEQCPYQLRLGWGSGLTGTTIDLLFKDKTRQNIRDLCFSLKAPGFEAPKSRRTVIGNHQEIKFVPGWVKFKGL